ncbi:MAG: Glu/Leu/Phe/Val dehydrogenase family protein [Planctomycetota bacterium]|nr:MAG: Glu/Leu/Phe/Val dehydrogenase family protein [Planctomycetota bacterium]
MEFELLDWMAQSGHDRVLAVQEARSGLRAWIALHHPRHGRAYGGIRVWNYRSEAEAALDALRLSQAMTYKCVLAGVAGGGAKTVVMADQILDRPRAMARLGEKIQELGGVYRAGPDVGFTVADQEALAKRTHFLAHHGSGLRPAGEATAEGAEYGIRAGLEFLDGECRLEEKVVAIQGLGAVGMALAARLIQAGAKVIGADPDSERTRRAEALGVQVVDAGAIVDAPADVFSPCALGGSLHDLTIQRLRVRLVAGAANNVLARPDHARLLDDRGILFIPDFVLNAGALIEGAGFEREGRTDWQPELLRIGQTVKRVLQRARDDRSTTVEAAHQVAREMLQREIQKTKNRAGASS